MPLADDVTPDYVCFLLLRSVGGSLTSARIHPQRSLHEVYDCGSGGGLCIEWNLILPDGVVSLCFEMPSRIGIGKRLR